MEESPDSEGWLVSAELDLEASAPSTDFDSAETPGSADFAERFLLSSSTPQPPRYRVVVPLSYTFSTPLTVTCRSPNPTRSRGQPLVPLAVTCRFPSFVVFLVAVMLRLYFVLYP
ncbi:hypothetical protein C0Z10_13050 [Acidipropionibacterium jensenii]|uniref:Uncharacterized protein n=1 Tax=Acidipropionibacterium jensenii TaxID=1749 RepID=A0A3T0S2A7_9ACTN|nr:hypothetical protein C0Z10_13050 [Acidipropionibacterium jensenii]